VCRSSCFPLCGVISKRKEVVWQQSGRGRFRASISARRQMPDSAHCRPSYTVSGHNPFKGMTGFRSDDFKRISILIYPGCIVGVANAFIISRKDWYRHFVNAISRLYLPVMTEDSNVLCRPGCSSASSAIAQSIAPRYRLPLFSKKVHPIHAPTARSRQDRY
jgi:hypothetical protein